MSRLAFPGVTPGYDPTHVLGPALFSGVCLTPGTFTNLLTGLPGVVTGSGNTAKMLGITGPGVNIATSTRFAWANSATPSGPNVTFAGIVVPTSSLGNQSLFDTDGAGTGGNGFAWGTQSLVPKIFVKPSFSAASSGVTLVVGVPYFIAQSCNATASNHVVRRLDTGTVVTATAGGLTAPSAPNGTCELGNYGTSNFSPDYTFHTTMWSQNFCSLQSLILAADNPWSYWYPNK